MFDTLVWKSRTLLSTESDCPNLRRSYFSHFLLSGSRTVQLCHERLLAPIPHYWSTPLWHLATYTIDSASLNKERNETVINVTQTPSRPWFTCLPRGATSSRQLRNVSPLAVRFMEDPGLFQDQFLGVCIFLLPLTLFFLESYSALSNHLFLSFPTDIFTSAVFLNTLFSVLSSDILSTCPKHLYLPFMVAEITCGSLCVVINSRFIRILHTPFSFTGPNIFISFPCC
jgi:hypothetical protein